MSAQNRLTSRFDIVCTKLSNKLFKCKCFVHFFCGISSSSNIVESHTSFTTANSEYPYFFLIMFNWVRSVIKAHTFFKHISHEIS